MLNKGKNIEDLFEKAFHNAEISPPSNMWDNLESSLNEHGVETIFKKAFINNTITPSKKIWNKIAYILLIQNFLKFNPTSFNVYYAAFTAFVGIICFNIFNNKADISPIHNTCQTAEIRTQSVSSEQKNALQSQISEQPTTNSNQTESVTNTVIPENNSLNKPAISKKSEESTITNTFDFSKIRIIGKTKLCTSSDAEYVMEGVPVESEIEWNLNQKDGLLKFISTRKISATWNKEGDYSISAQVKIGNTKKKIELPITVEAAIIPTIKGKNKVCEGQEKQMYSIDELYNKNIQYDWSAKNNPIDFIGNKYINIDWNKSGKDTLFVTRVNKETGCKSHSNMAIQISPKPSINFEMTPMGNSEFEFKYIGNAKKLSSILWNIDGNKYTDDVIIHENNGIGTSLITLQVKDKNNCVNTLQREVSFNKHIIFVPQQFSTNDNDGFIPQTNNSLKSYKIEIFNARNEKIWESTELSNGKPAKSWDGTSKGSVVSRGKYYWRITAIFDDGTQWKGVKQPNGDIKSSGIFILEN